VTSRAEKKRQQKAKTISKAMEAKATPDRTIVTGRPAEPIIRDGLAWLVKKNRLTPSQRKAANAYRKVYREPQPGAMRSHLDDTRAGGGAGMPPDLNQAFYDAQVQLKAYRTEALQSHGDLISVMDAVVGNGLTLAEYAGSDSRKTGKWEAVLMVALDLLAQYLDSLTRQNAPYCVLAKSA